jgi:hypothetical protein
MVQSPIWQAQFRVCLQRGRNRRPREVTASFSQYRRRAIKVLCIGALDNSMNQKAICIGHDMTLSTVHFLAHIIAAHAFTLGHFDRLAVDHSSTLGAFLTDRYPRILDDIMVGRLPSTIITPTIKIMLRWSRWRKARRHHPTR